MLCTVKCNLMLWLPVLLLFLCRIVRLSSPNLNLLVGIGAIILYMDIIITVIPTTSKVVNTILCNVSSHVIFSWEKIHFHELYSKCTWSLIFISWICFGMFMLIGTCASLLSLCTCMLYWACTCKHEQLLLIRKLW